MRLVITYENSMLSWVSNGTASEAREKLIVMPKDVQARMYPAYCASFDGSFDSEDEHQPTAN